MINRVIGFKKPRNLLLLFNILAIGLLFFYKDIDYDRKTAISVGVLIALLYGSNIILEKVTTGDSYIFMVVSMLVSIGAIMNYSINQRLGIVHLGWALFGIVGFYVTYFLLKYIDIWDKLMTPYILLALALFIATQIFGRTHQGSRNWIMVGNYSFQPTEFIKIVLIFIIGCFYYNKDYFKTIKYSSLILMGIVYIFMGFLFLQRDMGTVGIYFAIFIGLQFVYEEDRRLLLLTIGSAILGLGLGYLLFPHVVERFDYWLDPYMLGAEQILESLYAIGSGGFTGSGIGLGYPLLIPEVSSDFIFAAICEEMGLLTGIGVIMLFILLLYRGFKIALAQPHPFYRLLAIGVSISFSVQTFICIGGVIKLIPMTGITIPFVSYGGTSMFASFISLAVLQVASEDLKHKALDLESSYE